MSVERQRYSDALDALADHFVQAAEMVGTEHGWGQFVDRRFKQVGPYGTSSALIVLCLAGRAEDAKAKDAFKRVQKWWSDYRKDTTGKYFVQTCRLAYLCLALSTHDSNSSLAKAVANELKGRLLRDEGWGAYRRTTNDYDETVQVVPTSLATIALAAYGEEYKQSLVGPSRFLKQRLLGRSLSKHEAAIVRCALIAAEGVVEDDAGTVNTRGVGRFLSDCWVNRGMMADLDSARSLESWPYFFDYVFGKPDPKDRRDYFILLPPVLLAIAGMTPSAPVRMRLAAEEIAESLLDHLSREKGVFRVPHSRRAATVDQAWVALLLSKAATREYIEGEWAAKLWYFLARRREAHPLLARWVPGLAMITTGFLSAAAIAAGFMAAAAGDPAASLFPRVIAPVLAMVVTAILPKDSIQRMVRGVRRENT